MSEIKKCLYCDAEIRQTPGKRERKFCTPSHCTLFHLREKKKNQPEKPKGRPKGSKNKDKVVGAVSLPEDYVEFKNVGVLGADGEIIPIDTSAMEGVNFGIAKEAIAELINFSTVTTKTEIVDGKATQKVVDKKKVVNGKPKSAADQLEERLKRMGN